MDVLGPDGRADGLRVENSILAGEGAELDSREHRRGAGLVDEDVGTFVQEHLVTRVRAYVNPDLVGHRPGRRVQCRLLAKQVRHVLLEPVHRRVLTEHVVPDRRLEHCPPHAFRRTGHRVTAKIYQGSPPSLCSAVSSTRRVVAKWIFATSPRPSSPSSPTTRRPASKTCVAPSGNLNPTCSERRSISSSCRARATIDAAATAASSSARVRTSSCTPSGTNGSRSDRTDPANSSTTTTSTSSTSLRMIVASSSLSSLLTFPAAALRAS